MTGLTAFSFVLYRYGFVAFTDYYAAPLDRRTHNVTFPLLLPSCGLCLNTLAAWRSAWILQHCTVLLTVAVTLPCPAPPCQNATLTPDCTWMPVCLGCHSLRRARSVQQHTDTIVKFAAVFHTVGSFLGSYPRILPRSCTRATMCEIVLPTNAPC